MNSFLQFLQCPFARLGATLSSLLMFLVFGHAALASGTSEFKKFSLVSGGETTALTQYKVDNWQTEQGMASNTVQSLFQTKDGYLWIGTSGGLNRFDGVRFTSFEQEHAPEVAAQPIFGFMQDSLGRLWIGHTKGAAIFHAGQFTTGISADQTAGRRVWAFAEAKDGSIWAASENGLIRWQDGKTTLWQQEQGLPTNRLRGLCFDRDGALWIATSGGGLVAFRDGKFSIHDPAKGFPHREVRAVLADPDGGVWATTAGAGLIHVRDGRYTHYGPAQGLPTEQLTSLQRDRHGALWIGTWGSGVVRYSLGRFDSISLADGLAGDQIWTTLIDREDSVWIGTWVGGLNRLRNRPFQVLGTPEGLSHDNVRSILHGRDGATWIATSGGGLNRIKDQHIQNFGKRSGLPSEEVSVLHETPDKTLWVGTYTAGIARLQDDRFQVFGVADGLPSGEIRSLYEDTQGRLWVGTRIGLAQRNGSRFVAVSAEGLPPEGIATIVEDKQGTLWFGTTGKGLVRYANGKFRTFTTRDGLVSNWIMSLAVDADGALWIGTNGAGLSRLKDDRFSSIRVADGLWDGLVQTLLEDSAGRFWITCNRGFYAVSKKELNDFSDGRATRVESTIFGSGDALRSTSFAGGLQSAGAIDQRGLIWLPSARGIVIVDPDNLPRYEAAPEVRFDGGLVNGRRVSLSEIVQIPPGAIPLTIRYAAMTLLHADRVRFRYQLEGLHAGWVDAGKNRELVFPTLVHGHYSLRVGASLDGANWREAEVPVRIEVQPAFYQTLWFRALLLTVLIVTVLAVIRVRTRMLRIRQEQLEHLVAERTEELRLANDELSRLSYADALTGLANRRKFIDCFEDEWRRALRTHTPIGLLIADIDYFKQYNDSLGHLAGDDCLTRVAVAFKAAACRAGDLAARYGGEEFVVMLPNADDEAVMRIGQSLRQGVEALKIPHPLAPARPVVTVSVGVAAMIPSADLSPQMLISRADAALYAAKAQGRNCVCAATDSTAKQVGI